MRRMYLFVVLYPLLFISIQLRYFFDDNRSSAERGAKNVYELGEVVFNAFKLNDYNMLVKYLPNDSELEYLKNQTPEKNKYIFESINYDDLESNTKVNFDNVIQKGLENSVNWSEIEMQESKIRICKTSDSRMCEGIMSLEDLKGNSLRVSFDMVKVKDRWFLFQGMRVKSEAVGKR